MASYRFDIGDRVRITGGPRTGQYAEVYNRGPIRRDGDSSYGVLFPNGNHGSWVREANLRRVGLRGWPDYLPRKLRLRLSRQHSDGQESQ